MIRGVYGLPLISSDNCDVCYERGPLNCPTIVDTIGAIAARRVALWVADRIGLIADPTDAADPGWCFLWLQGGV